jgi:magnesium and cobalt transporter
MNPPKPSLLERLSTMLLREPEDRDQLVGLLHSAFERRLLDAEALSMIEGVLQVSETQVRDVMIPRSQMDMIDVADSPGKFIPYVIETSHSRFPVFEDNRDNVIGILLAKDLLRFYAEEEFNVREMLRPAVFVPEAKRLNVLLKEFRANRNHIAIVVDEYGGVAGLITIEDVLEQIVGDIEDEFEEPEPAVRPLGDGDAVFKGSVLVSEANRLLGLHLPGQPQETLAGLCARLLVDGPNEGETIAVDGARLAVEAVTGRRAWSVRVTRVEGAA